MKVLIIPDVHLKPWMFGDAEKIFLEKKADRAICLGDLLDDWGCENDDQLYWDTLDGAVDFATRYPVTLWCHGNHDLAYVWNTWVSGTSSDLLTRQAARNGLKDLFSAIPDGNLAYVHRIDNVLFFPRRNLTEIREEEGGRKPGKGRGSSDRRDQRAEAGGHVGRRFAPMAPASESVHTISS